jgi:hypothetical protein
MNKWSTVAIAIAGVGVVAGALVYITQSKPAPATGAVGEADPAPSRSAMSNQAVEPAVPVRKSPRLSLVGANGESPASANSHPPSPVANPAGSALFTQAIENLVSPQSSFGQRYEALEHLRKSGQLDQAISELERRMADDPRSAECPAALGRAYLQKCGTIQDVREQGILAMKADQVFDAALNLDPYNWEARFTKAVAMSYWPTQLNKSAEVIQHFSTLMGQQEAQAPQPHFAQTYLWMGDAYQKYGRPDYAQQVWERGAALFPDNQELRNKLGR